MDSFPVEIQASLSKHLAEGADEAVFGRYRFSRAAGDGARGDIVLSFTSTYWHPEGGGSHPEEEAENVLRLLSVLCNARHRRGPLRVSGVSIPAGQAETYPEFRGEIETSQIGVDLERFQKLDEDLARQFLRASHAYGFALEFIPSDVTFAFFLLVVAVECLSSQQAVIAFDQLNPQRQSAERFVKFIEAFLPESERGADERDGPLLRKLLKTIYYSHRSAFVHGGKEVSAAAIMADRVGSSYFKHELDGEEVQTPGIGWFARIARGSLMGFLRAPDLENRTADQELLARLAFEKARMRMKAKRAVEAHRIVTMDDIEYR